MSDIDQAQGGLHIFDFLGNAVLAEADAQLTSAMPGVASHHPPRYLKFCVPLLFYNIPCWIPEAVAISTPDRNMHPYSCALQVPIQ